MKEYTEEEVQKALQEIESMDHYTMCKLWRFGSNPVYFCSDLPTGKAFKERLFDHFGGFTPEMSKLIGW